jgi:transposase
MKHYIGLDVSMKETCICVVDEAGRIIYEGNEKTDPKLLAIKVKEKAPLIEKVALESGSLSNWLITELEKEGLPAICVDARHMAAVLSTNPNKNDRNDARGIAQAVRAGYIREVSIKSQTNVDISVMLSARKMLVGQRRSQKNTIRGLLKSYGIRIQTSGSQLFIKLVREKIVDLPLTCQLSIKALIAIYELLDREISALNNHLEAIAEADEEAKLLMTIPGVGVITALSFKTVIRNPGRFGNSRDVGAYLGMTPREYSSGESQRKGRISKCGHGQMRSLLVEAATVMLTRTKSWSKPKAWALKIAKKKGMKKAAVALGRKLSVIMHRMLITKEKFKFGEEAKAT